MIIIILIVISIIGDVLRAEGENYEKYQVHLNRTKHRDRYWHLFGSNIFTIRKPWKFWNPVKLFKESIDDIHDYNNGVLYDED